jgi:uncharacterized membrane protein YfcA
VIPHGAAEHAILAVAGVATGFLNMIAGGGSLISLPVLMLLGLPADVANGTNRLAIVSQSFAGTTAFQRLGRYDRRGVTWVLTASAAGAATGAFAATLVPPGALRVVLLVVMIAMSITILVTPRAIGAAAPDEAPRWETHRAAGAAGLFAAGLYGGFIQAGVGFLLMAVLGGILHYDVLGTAALKTLSTLVFGALALAIFAAAGMVDWPIAALLAAYTTVGALAGVRMAQRAPHRLLRAIAFGAAVAVSLSALLLG